MYKNIALWLLFFTSFLSAQEEIKGKIVDENNQPLLGANVFWQNTATGTTSDIDGNFTLKKSNESDNLVVSYIGYKTKKITITSTDFLTISLEAVTNLEEVTVSKTKKSTEHSKYQVTNVQTMGQKELLKAACCNISESFSTNPSIDVNFSDAVTGNKQIKMLGLTSPYILIAEENIPSVRGASQAYGLSFVPGTWVESIQITKGAGSVINGYESISGQINYEILKPVNDIPFFLNAYTGMGGRYELNAHFNQKYSDKLSSTLFLHGNTRQIKNDMNDDGFLDNPIGKQINVLNRWQYNDAENGIVSFLNIRYMKDEKQSGQVDFNPDSDKFTTNAWGSEINTEKVEISNKTGYVFPNMPYQSIGFQNSFQSHQQDSYFGLNQYKIHQKSYYSNLLFNSIISNTKNKFTTGLNFSYDAYDEAVAVNFVRDFSRIDNSVGAFFEYTYDNLDNFSLVAGARVDNHNRLGTFITPRLHLRYNPWKEAVVRASIGRGKRAANIFAENQQLFASSRDFSILSNDGKLYGLNPEIAWNYGVSFIQSFKLFGAESEVVLDYYRTDFDNQAVVDVDFSPQQVLFYNLEGKSFANSFQAEFTIEPFKHFSVKTAYKYYDVQSQYKTGQLQRALQAKHRFFTNVSFETHIKEKGQQWKYDVTYNWLGEQRLPNTTTNLPEYKLSPYAPAFGVFNAQITRTFSSVFEVYVGGENIGNYKQDNAIVSASNPFGTYFDSSMIYGPVFGQMYYAGLRFKIK
ncbi:MAG: TonB-dependent receptor [Flavobacterium sp.]|uniref:TonB-dependent receptor n=1 Tax=unclassified Flavobacterium TaxID=196869 RepID=UPI000C6277E5|nr:MULTISPECIES: TonB-dependent receptor [unclassified Flavobacterium]MBF04467.1 TonB-dependent receptor [Flavobacterium sp.]MCO6162363.1 TonB-dependent receptor [Flavobacterium sp. NRK F7]|tara:strand:- start:939 stop:3179 length:2241 start_codon:yes stop_codon:yes gene_type:complete